MVDPVGTESEGGTVAGRYEVHDYPAAGHGLKLIVWVEPGKPPQVMTTIAPGRLPALAEALNRHLTDDSPTGELAPAWRWPGETTRVSFPSVVFERNHP